ncbi:hypothetical protein N9E40_05700 [Amylibacter sp.]|nr:hypothetical protein [Amylibacter sp.]MDA8800540.1 hypothetical protein [Amylibacter sp.]MDB0015771.1 hypothetical protein [Amylibacter sp.]MDB2524779.1 hypothetical protein [Amylibacter sp.]MDB9852579.1 hypothetical protein [Amylibacter sp.]
MLDKAWTRFTFNIWALQNPPSPNELLSKGYRIAEGLSTYKIADAMKISRMSVHRILNA